MIFFYITMIAMLLCNFYKGKKSLHMLQQNVYDENHRYLKWMASHRKKVIGWDVFAIFFTLVGALILYDLFTTSTILLLVLTFFYFFESYGYLRVEKDEKSIVPLVVTSRVKRLIVTLSMLYLLPVFVSFFFLSSHSILWYFLFALSILTAFHYYVVYLAYLINYPLERMIYYHYKHKALKKLQAMPNLKVIGITGSYGKTSSKNILNDVLNCRFVSRPTPKSYNTYNGLIKTINNDLDKFDEIFIAEMGAYARGDIKGLCDIVKPKYGILTRIGTSHLESFGSEENIVKTKFELIESLPADGIAVLNMDDEKQVSYPLKNNVRVLWIGIENENADFRAMHIKCDGKGTSFDFVRKGDKKKYSFETKLLGRHNVYNILAALALGLEFGIPMTDLIKAVHSVRPVEHRLELKKLGEIYQIDDAYNSNPVGASSALEVLSFMNGTKVVVTPGMVELGKKERELNKAFGEQMSKVADYVILVGTSNTKPILDGLLECGFDNKNITIVEDVRDTYPIVLGLKEKQKDIFALYENDRIDSYKK